MGRKNALSEAQKQVANGIGLGLLVYGFSIAALGAIGAGLHGFEKKADLLRPPQFQQPQDDRCVCRRCLCCGRVPLPHNLCHPGC
mmetsp:Transcript_2426/g.3760  ORF Transcript_2426/g.3760 Transcript_2426/m.3760 type:complete len:85 (+) Transcript_2426:35-289(+)